MLVIQDHQRWSKIKVLTVLNSYSTQYIFKPIYLEVIHSL